DYDIELETKECERLNLAGNGKGERIPLVPAPKWQPIDTAPKDDTKVWGYERETGWQGRMTFTVDAWRVAIATNDHNAVAFFRCNPTHWMPLPEPPHGV